jgi:hypothetical protein
MRRRDAAVASSVAAEVVPLGAFANLRQLMEVFSTNAASRWMADVSATYR